MKKLLAFMLALAAIYFLVPERALAEEEPNFEEILSTLIGSLDGQALNDDIDDVWKEMDLDGDTFEEKISSVISGDFAADYGNVLSAVFSMIFSGIKSLIPILMTVCAIAVFYSLVKTLSPGVLSEGTDRILYFTCYAAILGLLIYKAFDVALACMDSVGAYAKRMDAVFPLILTVMSATGANVSAAVYQPAVAFLSTGITNVITRLVMPAITALILFSSVSGLSQTLKTDKLSGFISSAVKWILGISATVFTLFLSVQGLTAGTYDGVSLRVTKYAVGNSVPVVGGFLKDGAELFVASGVLIKNALGIMGVVMIAGILIKPIAALVAFSLFLKFAAGIIEPIADGRMSDYLTSLSKNLGYVLASALVVCFMYVITIVLLICTGSAFI